MEYQNPLNKKKKYNQAIMGNLKLIYSLISGTLFDVKMIDASIEVKHGDYSRLKVSELDDERNLKCYRCEIVSCSGITSVGLMHLHFKCLKSPDEISTEAKCHPRIVSTK